ncbi:LssY C-terminal domain-containing protein [Brachybacterium timonense]|uniref:LssY C-terminal domain-containing protein n=1 Tax=Brachybacterium timonense TaxID=2050896 RepID=UPI000D0ABB6A|nr:LssY C-terminal domain-containing protein [Brachybacterium timonense]
MTPARRSRLAPLQRPVPSEPPEYDHDRGHTTVGPRIEIYGLLDTLFIIAGLVVSVWLAVLYLLEGFSLTPVRLLYLVGFWLLLTYIALPRLHQLLTWIYLPDYFFGRTRTTEGVLSDPINLAFDGKEVDLHVAMRKAGWVLAEERTVGSAWGMVRATLMRDSYPSAPVSDLYLLGRRHDFTYQQEVGGTTAKRHHVRFWRVPKDFVLPGGYRADWLAAGTYDRAVGFSFFTLQFTHRIDENIDVERDYIIDTVRYADPDIDVEVIEDFSTSYLHRNGQGDRIRTDGDLPIVDVTGAAARSDGATAVMLPRHRPTGISVMKARALAAAQAAVDAKREKLSRRQLSGQWQDTVEDLQDVWAGAADHHLPPPTILFTAGLVLVQAILLGIQWAARALDADLGLIAEDVVALLPHADALGAATVLCLVSAALVVGVFRRNRWARLALMAVFTADALVRLAMATSATGEVEHSLLVGVGASALGVMAISSDASRLWVQTQRLGPRD